MILIHDFSIIKQKLDPILIKEEDLKFKYSEENEFKKVEKKKRSLSHRVG